MLRKLRLYFASDTQRNATHSVWQNAVLVISAALHESFVRIKHFPSVSQFLLYWMRIICCIYRVFVRPLKTFLQPSLIHVRVKLQILRKYCAALSRRIPGF